MLWPLFTFPRMKTSSGKAERVLSTAQCPPLQPSEGDLAELLLMVWVTLYTVTDVSIIGWQNANVCRYKEHYKSNAASMHYQQGPRQHYGLWVPCVSMHHSITAGNRSPPFRLPQAAAQDLAGLGADCGNRAHSAQFQETNSSQLFFSGSH